MDKIKAAVGQFSITSSLEENKKAICRLITKASQKKAKILLLAECCLTGYAGSEIASNDQLNWKDVQAAIKEISLFCQKKKIYAAFGTAFYYGSGKGWGNSLLVFSDKGKKVCHYDKMALTRSDKKNFQQGDKLPTFKIDKVIFGCQICFDVRFPDNYRKLFAKNVHVVLHAYHQAGVPEISKQRRSIMTAFQRVRSSENGIYTLSANAIGPNKGKHQWVPTMIVNPRGDIVTEVKSSQEDIAIAEMDTNNMFENIEMDIRETSCQFLGLKKGLPLRKVAIQ